MSNDTNIVYWGSTEEKEAGGVFFTRGEPTPCEPKVAGELCRAKPRIFFYERETPPQELLDEWFMAPLVEIDQLKSYIKTYERVGFLYEADGEKGEFQRIGAEKEVTDAQARLVEWEEERDRRFKGVKAEDRKRIENRVLANVTREKRRVQDAKQAERVAAAQRRASLGALAQAPGGEALATDPTLSGV